MGAGVRACVRVSVGADWCGCVWMDGLGVGVCVYVCWYMCMFVCVCVCVCRSGFVCVCVYV